MRGLLRLTPSLEDFISVLRYHRERLRGASAAGKDLQPVMTALESISTNVWKTFYIKRSLHPYSPAALRALKDTLLSDDLLPTLSASGEPTGIFVSATGKTTDSPGEDSDDDDVRDGEVKRPIRVISVDDLSLFKKLQEHLDGKLRTRKIHWIYTGYAGGVTDPAELDFDDVNCNLQRLEEDVKDTLNLMPSDFSRAVTTIAPETFLAPKSTATLFHFLGITALSSLFLTEACTAPSEAARAQLKAAASPDWSPATLALTIINSLLEIAQRVLFTEGRSDLFQLAERGRLKSLLFLQLQDSTYLQRVVRLKPGVLPPEYCGFEMSQSLPFQRSKDPEETLLINKSCSEGEVVTMCIDLIMHALRIEVALNDQNQRQDLMTKLADTMGRFAQNPNERFRFDYLNIQELPQTCDPWKMKSPSVSKQFIETIVEDEEDAPESRIEDFSLRAVKPDQTLLKFIEESNARAMMQRQVATEAKAISAEEAAVLHANKARQGILSDHLAAIMLHCPTTPNLKGPILPDPSMEVLRYQGMMNPRTADSSELEGIHQSGSHGVQDRGLLRGGALSLSVGPPRPSDSIDGSGNSSGSRSSTNGPEPSWHNTASGGQGSAGSFFRGIPFTSAPTRPEVELNFHVFGEDLFQNDSLAQMGRVAHPADMPRVMLSNNASSGRIGECLAFEFLRLKAAELGFIEAEWVNSVEETGQPYDIKLVTRDGVVKYCEVKTRSFRDTGDRDKEHCQWFISLNEVLAAVQLNSDFFALCLSISVNVDESKVTPHSANFIGLEGGFVQALDRKGASLILQDNRTRLPPLTLIQDNRINRPLPALTLIQDPPTQLPLPPLTLILS
jgi:Domain of unknown function (DUF3883)